MTGDQKAILEPVAQQIYAWEQWMRGMDDDELSILISACSAASITNCWCETFRAAGLLLPRAREIRNERALMLAHGKEASE
jgi:hypothetical protein